MKTVFVVRRTGDAIDWVQGRDVWYHEAGVSSRVSARPRKWMPKIRSLFSIHPERRENPREVTTLPVAISLVGDNARYVFDYRDRDVYWCTADVGWVTGHSYIVYGPLANGVTTFMFEGVPNCRKRRVSVRSLKSMGCPSFTQHRPPFAPLCAKAKA